MNLNDFEKHIDDTILGRGLDYYESGCIVSLDYDGDDVWIAEVEGGDDYTVSVTLSVDGEILETDCDCPYDWGPFCKHQAAVLYALKKKHAQGKTSAKEPKKKKLEDVLALLDKQKLASIVLDFAKRDRRLKEEILLRYDEKSDILKSARSLIQSSIKSAEHRGFVAYGDTADATDGADTVLDMAEQKAKSGNTLAAVSLCIVVLEEMMDLLDYCDDSDGYVGETISEAIERIGETVEAMPPDQSDNVKVFGMVFDHALGGRYSGWTDWRVDLLSAVVPLCAVAVNRSKMEEYLFAGYGGVTQDKRQSNFESQSLQDLQAEIIKRFDGEEAAVAFMEKNVFNDAFRRTLIQKSISEGEYEKALKLCQDGEWEDERHANQWKPLRYGIYEKTGDKDGQRKLGQELLLGGSFDYYDKLKALYSKKEWPAVIQTVLAKLPARQGHGVYVKILIQEKLKPQLLDYCRQNPHCVASYYGYLLPEYAGEAGEILSGIIREFALRANNRKSYSEICGLVRHYEKCCGRNAALAIRDELKTQHLRQPAFLDELRKL